MYSNVHMTPQFNPLYRNLTQLKNKSPFLPIHYVLILVLNHKYDNWSPIEKQATPCIQMSTWPPNLTHCAMGNSWVRKHLNTPQIPLFLPPHSHAYVSNHSKWMKNSKCLIAVQEASKWSRIYLDGSKEFRNMWNIIKLVKMFFTQLYVHLENLFKNHAQRSCHGIARRSLYTSGLFPISCKSI